MQGLLLTITGNTNTFASVEHADSTGRPIVVSAEVGRAADSLGQRSKPWTFVGR